MFLIFFCLYDWHKIFVLINIFQVLAQMLSFVGGKAVQADSMVDEEEGFMQIVEAEKKVETKKFIPKYPPRTVSGAVFTPN